MTSSASMGYIEGIASLLSSEKYSDLLITTQARSFKVHKAIICTQSKVLAAMCDSGFRETFTSSLLLNDDDPSTVERMITFLYTGKYESIDTDVFLIDGRYRKGTILTAHTLVYSIADKYDIGSLKVQAKRQFESFIDSKVPALDAWEIPLIFNTTPDTDMGLRDVVIERCADHIDDVLASHAWSTLLARNGEIAVSILREIRQRSIARQQRLRRYE